MEDNFEAKLAELESLPAAEQVAALAELISALEEQLGQ